MRSEGYSTWFVIPSVCPSVYLSVTTFSATTRNETTKIAIPTCSFLHWLENSDFVEVVRSNFMAWKPSAQANMLISTSTWSACSVYPGGTRSHNEGRVRISTPACYTAMNIEVHEDVATTKWTRSGLVWEMDRWSICPHHENPKCYSSAQGR